MTRYIIFFYLIIGSCQYNGSNEVGDISIEIKTDSVAFNYQEDSIYNKKVFATKIAEWFEPNKNTYIITMFYEGRDSLISFSGGFSEELDFNFAKYTWTSDSSINITLFGGNNDSSKVVFLRGSMDGSGGQNGYLN